jgi:hypothetical protein
LALASEEGAIYDGGGGGMMTVFFTYHIIIYIFTVQEPCFPAAILIL